MKSKWLAILLVPFLLGGCSSASTGIDSLLKPPTLSEEQNDIYNALLSSVVNRNIKLKFPRSGDYTSAFLIEDLDGEPTDEAIVFYDPSDSASTSTIRINVMDQDEKGDWYSIFDAGGVAGASEVERIDFVTVDSKTFLVVGFNLGGSTEKSVVAYEYASGRLTDKKRINCANYAVCDINNDGREELITITQQLRLGGVPTVLAEMRAIDTAGEFPYLSSANLDPEVSEYKNILTGLLPDGRIALYLDGVRGNDIYTTEIIACERDELQNLIYDPNGQWSLIRETRREYGAPSVDLDKDGVVEIPVREAAPGYEDSEKHQQEVFTEWYIYDEGFLQIKETTYVAYPLGYVFILPERWVGNVTVDYNSTERELTFYDYTGGEVGNQVMSIKVVAPNSIETEGYAKGYSQLMDNGQIIYMYQLYDTSSFLALKPDELKRCFQLYKD